MRCAMLVRRKVRLLSVRLCFVVLCSGVVGGAVLRGPGGVVGYARLWLAGRFRFCEH